MRPLEITSTTHATALSTYAVLALLGGAWSTDVASADTLLAKTGPVFTGVWALAVLVAGLAALVSALITPHVPIPRGSLKTEGVACVVLCVCVGIYGWSILGLGYHTNQVLVGCFMVGTGWRAVQVWQDLRRMSRALAGD